MIGAINFRRCPVCGLQARLEGLPYCDACADMLDEPQAVAEPIEPGVMP